MDRPAFVIPGVKAVFAMDTINTDFIHHELFHQFFSENRHGEKRYFRKVFESINDFSKSYDDYRKMCEIAYGKSVSDSIICEEIAADLCEYAMSGSRKMRNRLEGLFMPGELEALAERARKVFKSNQQENRTNKKPKKSDTRYYLEEAQDSEGNELTKEQAEFFKDSNVRDEDGRLLVVYHGTEKEFTVFNPKLTGDIGMHFGTLEQAKQFVREGQTPRIT